MMVGASQRVVAGKPMRAAAVGLGDISRLCTGSMFFLSRLFSIRLIEWCGCRCSFSTHLCRRTPSCHSEQGVECDCNDCIDSQRRHKIFEILRIRNQLDPALLDVPGGYRDFAMKIEIGFFRRT